MRPRSAWAARLRFWPRLWRSMHGFGSRARAIRCGFVITQESRHEQAGNPQERHSGMDGAAPGQAADRGTNRRLCRQDAAAPRAAAQPPRPLSGDDGMAAAANRTAVTIACSSTTVLPARLSTALIFVILQAPAIPG